MNGIDPKKFKAPKLTYSPHLKEYNGESNGYWKTTSQEYGRSQGATDCGACGFQNNIYIWSFIGGGKKCENCGSVMLAGSVHIPLKNMTKKQLLDLIEYQLPEKLEEVKLLKLKKAEIIEFIHQIETQKNA